MISIFTNKSSMAATKSIFSSNSVLNQSMGRLGTGKRINSAADDAAGLQIATRLTGQTNGMKVAQKNISDANSLLQTAEGSLDEITNMVYRMKDLATQAANDTNSQADLVTIAKEYTEIAEATLDMMDTASFGGKLIFGTPTGTHQDGGFDMENGYLAEKGGFNIQIGHSTSETMNIDVKEDVRVVASDLATSLGAFRVTGTNDLKPIITNDLAKNAIEQTTTTLDSLSSLRGTIGAKQNRLAHTAANLQNMQDNLSVGLGNIQDADYATEASRMTRSQMLAQTSMSMLKQSNSMNTLVQSLLN